MSAAPTLTEYLDGLHLDYDIVTHTHTDSSLRSAEAAHVSGELVAKSILLGDEHSYLLAVIPASHRLDVGYLNKETSRQLEMVNESEIEAAFSDCEKGAIPAVGEAYGIDTIVDSGLLRQSSIYFESGDHEHLIKMKRADFQELMKNARKLEVSHHL